MGIIISDISLPIHTPPAEAIAEAVLIAGAGASEADAKIVKRSVDARKSDIKFVYSVYLGLPQPCEERIIARLPQRARLKKSGTFEPKAGSETQKERPVIAGFGPAGIFCALLLARRGYRPIVLERGAEMEKRCAAVSELSLHGVLDSRSNIQFGEGGAGTFSDGKLTTRINDPLCDMVLAEFVRFGAPESIIYDAKPHIGTDIIREVVKNIRAEIIALGGEIRFETQLTGITMGKSGLAGVKTESGELRSETLVLAMGHSARDSYNMLQESGIKLEPKAFSCGVRIEHLQSEIDKALYGAAAGDPLLPPAEYQHSFKKDGRAVYTFCMCPGGVVVPSASEEGGVCTNGMSYSARDGENANSALVVAVTPSDFGTGALDGIAFQRGLERAAFAAGGGGFIAPSQSVGAFLGKGDCAGVTPSYKPGVKECDMKALFPKFIHSMLKMGIGVFDRKLSGFAAGGARLTGVETRTSSPVRILRGESFEAEGTGGVYPCGEGAGYAGGIMSAAVDGLRVAGAIIERYKSPKE